jgi:hypothetical protein
LNDNETATKIRDMLLGRLSEDERKKFEVEFIGDESMFDIVRATEDELIEQYAMNALSQNDRHAFESNYLPLESGRRKLALTRSLIERSKFSAVATVSETPSLMSSIVAFFNAQRFVIGAGSVVLAVIVGSIWFANHKTEEIAVQPMPIPSLTPHTRTPESIAPVQTPEVADLTNETEKKKKELPDSTPSPKIERGPIPMVALVAGSLRDAGKMPQLTIPKNANHALLSLKLDSADYRAYFVEVVDPDGRVVSRLRNLRGKKGRVSATVPTAKFASGEYIVKLSGIGNDGDLQSVGDYPLRVNKK